MNENINLCEILKDCPKGTKLYSTLYGNVKLKEISEIDDDGFPIKFGNDVTSGNVTKEGKHYYTQNGECTLFPAKDQRDWSKWKCPKPKFDSKTLKPFDRILVRNSCIDNWGCSFFSNHREDELFPFLTCDASAIKYCIPYNDDTKCLVGTTDEAPEYYRYWED